MPNYHGVSVLTPTKESFVELMELCREHTCPINETCWENYKSSTTVCFMRAYAPYSAPSLNYAEEEFYRQREHVLLSLTQFKEILATVNHLPTRVAVVDYCENTNPQGGNHEKE